MIQNLIFEISFLQKTFRAYKFLYSSTRFGGHHQSLFFNFRFFSRESQSQQKLPKKVTHFVKKNLTHYMNLNFTHYMNLNSLIVWTSTSLIIWTSTHSLYKPQLTHYMNLNSLIIWTSTSLIIWTSTSLIIWTSTHLKLKIICYAVATQPKTFLNLLKIFQQTCFCLVPEKNICTPPFLDAQNCILEALWKEMSVYFCISL